MDNSTIPPLLGTDRVGKREPRNIVPIPYMAGRQKSKGRAAAEDMTKATYSDRQKSVLKPVIYRVRIQSKVRWRSGTCFALRQGSYRIEITSLTLAAIALWRRKRMTDGFMLETCICWAGVDALMPSLFIN